MADKQKRVSLKDGMVLAGMVIGVIYWAVETLYYAFASNGESFWDVLFGAGLTGVGVKVIAICFFILLGAHAQYNLNKCKKLENDVASLSKELKKLKKK